MECLVIGTFSDGMFSDGTFCMYFNTIVIICAVQCNVHKPNYFKKGPAPD